MNLKRVAAAAMGLALTFSSMVFASEIDTEGRMEDLNYLYDTLKEVHPDIFYNTDEKDFLEKKAEIEKRIPYESDMYFSLDLQSLVSLVGDAHTSISISAEDASLFPVSMVKYDGEWTLALAPEDYADCIGMRIDTIAGYPVDELCKMFSAVFSADNYEVLEYRFSKNFYVDEFLSYLGVKELGEPLKIQVHGENGEKYELSVNSVSVDDISGVKMTRLSDMRSATPKTEKNVEYYSSEPIGEKAYYIQYNKCAVDPEFPIEKFEEKVENELNSGAYSQILIDMRNNGGGSDGVIQGVLKIVKDYADKNGSKVYGLIGERTFSSAIINSVMIKEMGGFLVGVPTGGSVNHFGSVNSFSLPNSGINVGYSTKMIWLSDYMDAAQGYLIEALQPDLIVYQSLEDYVNGIDTVVNTVLNDPPIKKYETGRTLYMTRGGLVTELYKLSEDTGKEYPAAEFYDVFSFSETYKPICWAAANDISAGTGDGLFAPARKITREEAAAIIDRFLKYMGVNTDGNEISDDRSDIGAWARQHVANVVSIGIMSMDNGDFRAKENITKDECGEIINKLADMLDKN